MSTLQNLAWVLMTFLFLGCVPNQEPDANILFVSEFCGPCHVAKAIISKLDADVKIVDIQKEKLLAAKYNILKVPTLIVRKDNKTTRVIGLKSKETYQKLLCTN